MKDSEKLINGIFTLAEQKIKELNELGITKGSTVKGKNFTATVNLISDLRAISDEDDFQIIADVEDVDWAGRIEDFTIWSGNKLQVEIKQIK